MPLVKNLLTIFSKTVDINGNISFSCFTDKPSKPDEDLLVKEETILYNSFSVTSVRCKEFSIDFTYLL